MQELSEQEQLAKLVGSEDGEGSPLDTGNMLEQGLKQHMGGAKSSNSEKSFSPIPHATRQAESDMPSSAPPARKVSSEKILVKLYEIRDGLIQSFSSCPLNSPMANSISIQINNTGDLINYLGGSAENFDPLDYVSGLETPNIIKNAQEVIERTIQCYRLGKIESAKPSSDGKEINILFTGTDGDTYYEASGRIIAENWTGDEAIDYVYTPHSGKMSVKAYKGDEERWVDKSDGENYHISWELKEKSISKGSTENSMEKSSEKEEVEQKLQNNITQEMDVVENSNEEDIGDPIN